MNITMLFLVLGSCGYHDDYTQWLVAALPDLAAAEDYRAKATEASKAAIEAYKRSPEGRGCTYVYFTQPTKYDLSHEVRDGEVTYRVQPVPLIAGAMDPSALFAVADAFATAQAVCRESNNPGISRRFGLPEPTPPVDVKSDFASKLQRALAH